MIAIMLLYSIIKFYALVVFEIYNELNPCNT